MAFILLLNASEQCYFCMRGISRLFGKTQIAKQKEYWGLDHNQASSSSAINHSQMYNLITVDTSTMRNMHWRKMEEKDSAGCIVKNK